MRGSLVSWHLGLLLIASLAGDGAGYSNPVGNPLGAGTVPPSSYESGLVSTPNPLDNGNNTVITGNVRGGKHFRADIPYDATTSFGAPLGSTRLDSFLRYSAVPEELGEYARDYSSFYSPTGTVASIRPGYSGVFAPTSPRIATGVPQLPAERPADVTALTEVPQPQVSTGETSSTYDRGFGAWPRLPYSPLSRTPREMQEVISDELGSQLPQQQLLPQSDQPVTAEEYQRQLEQLQREIDRVRADALELEQTLRKDDSSPALGPKDRCAVGEQRPLETTEPLPGATVPPGTVPPALAKPEALKLPSRVQEQEGLRRIPDVTPLPGQDQAEVVPIDRLMEPRPPLLDQALSPDRLASAPAAPVDRIDAIFTPRTRPQTGDDAEAPSELPALQRVQETSRLFNAPARFSELPAKELAGSEPAAMDRVSALVDRLRTTSGSQNVAPGAPAGAPDQAPPDAAQQLAGDRVLQKYRDTGFLSPQKAERYLKAAQLYLQQGRYYRAAESFTLAAMYLPSDPRAYLGKSHALFAAGEYVSSAVALGQALELDPRTALARTDLVNAVGGPDPFVQRITDLEGCAKTGSTPHLQLLLAYIYYQMDRPEEAKAALAAAEKGLPPTLALDLLKAALGQ